MGKPWENQMNMGLLLFFGWVFGPFCHVFHVMGIFDGFFDCFSGPFSDGF